MSNYCSYEKETYTCSHCGWNGLGKDCVMIEHFQYLFEIGCPLCHEKVGLVEYPLLSEMRNSDNEFDRVTAGAMDVFRDIFEEERLKSPDQLPDIDEDPIILFWESDGLGWPDNWPGHTLITHDDRVIWKEPRVFEGTWRFAEVVEILKKKYGDRLKDVIPLASSWLDLYGDYGGNEVEESRKMLSEEKNKGLRWWRNPGGPWIAV
ncbi:MAG: hypothetical protein FJZ16_00850 [Candidatus Omnitrophica bacterium]|nr:hypothetical protein [Candidatus Omnitrophota bacterium]